MKEVPVVGEMMGFGKIQYGPRVEGESITDYAMRLGMHNPAMAQSILTGVLSKVSEGALGQVIRQIAERGMGAALGGAPGGHIRAPGVVDMPGSRGNDGGAAPAAAAAYPPPPAPRTGPKPSIPTGANGPEARGVPTG